MWHAFWWTLIKVTLASFVVGTILTQMGITADVLVTRTGLSPERVLELVRQGLDWALPNLVLGALVIVPVWFVIFLVRPPRPRSDIH